MKWRYSVVFLFFLASFLGVWGKLFYYQVVKAQELSQLGQDQSAANIEIQPTRGEIRTSDGFPIVTNKLTYLLYANPQETKNPSLVTDFISNLLKIDTASISAQLSRMDKVWVPLARDVSNDEKNQITQQNLPGLGFEDEPKRFYPEASMAAQLVGFIGKDSQGEDTGYFGLEGYYDMQLKGRVGQTTIVKDAFGRPVLAKLEGASGQQDGRSLNLSIDRVLQFDLEKKLQKALTTYGAQSDEGIIMDPKTGEILAMASFPSFDPATFWQYDTSLYKNPVISDSYEPGSTFKPIVMSEALDEGLIKPTSTCPICDKPVQVGDYAIHTWNDQYTANISMLDIMIHSDNTGMVYIAQKLGLDGMLNTIQKFGFGQPTNIDLQGEASPPIREKDNWYPVDLATAGFGQGIAVTPIQLITAFASLANNGIRMQPHIVKSIQTSDGQVIPIAPKEVARTVSESTAKVMTEMLVDTVNKGEASYYRLKDYRIAGKTGTASIAKDGHYDSTKTIASFIGYAPADNPRFIMLIVMDRPSVSIYGAETAAPVFFDMSQDIFDHYNIAPDVTAQ